MWQGDGSNTLFGMSGASIRQQQPRRPDPAPVPDQVHEDAALRQRQDDQAREAEIEAKAQQLAERHYNSAMSDSERAWGMLRWWQLGPTEQERWRRGVRGELQ